MNHDFRFQPVEGMLSHQLEQNRIDGEKTIIQVGSKKEIYSNIQVHERKKCNWIPFQNPSEAQRKEHDKFEFALHEVYAVDVLISSGEGQGREKDAKITIYKKTEDT